MWTKKVPDASLVLPVRREYTERIFGEYQEYDPDSGMTEDEFFMKAALELAHECGECGEVPVGAVVVRDGKIVSLSSNGREVMRDATLHAETDAISKACGALGGWRLIGCTLYVTLEPCPMCAGAIINSRVPRVVIGAKDPNSGAMGSLVDLTSYPLGHKPEVIWGVLEDECSGELKSFFKKRREKNKET